MKVIDLRSDTKTLPTEEMRRATYKTELGDDVWGEDPTVNLLEEMAAQILDKEETLLTPSGTMSNLIAVLSHTRSGDEIILGSESHILWYERGGASALAGAIMRTVPNNENGQIEFDAIEETIRSADIHFPPTTLLCLENTHARCGGTVLTTDYTSATADLAHRYGLKVHLDGSRIFNAAIALNVPVSELVRPTDSVCFCLSKGLSAPVGSLLCGTREFIAAARKWRKTVGGSMRQAGVIAAAGIIALEKMPNRLEEDHRNAQRLAHGLAQIPGIGIHPEKVQTNIVTFTIPAFFTGVTFIQNMGAEGVKFLLRGGQMVRGVTHRMIEAADVDEALNRIEYALKKLS